MPLSRKNYVEIAGVMREAKTKHEVVQGLSDYFARDNPRFDPERFRKASKK